MTFETHKARKAKRFCRRFPRGIPKRIPQLFPGPKRLWRGLEVFPQLVSPKGFAEISCLRPLVPSFFWFPSRAEPTNPPTWIPKPPKPGSAQPVRLRKPRGRAHADHLRRPERRLRRGPGLGRRAAGPQGAAGARPGRAKGARDGFRVPSCLVAPPKAAKWCPFFC